MNPDRWRQVSELFHAAIDRAPGERLAFVTQAAGDDTELRREVLTLVESHERTATFLEQPAWGVGAHLILDDPETSLIGKTVGTYVIREEIGRGGMGVVYAADDQRLGRAVALKALTPEYTRDPIRRERLRLEARAAAKLSHPAIATVFALEEVNGELYIVSELVRGRTLRAELADGPLPAERLLPTLVDIAAALATAHAHGVVHRDLKPENIVRGLDGQVKVLDFGLARIDPARASTLQRLTETGMALGTPGYMAPEQFTGRDVDARTDIFAFGVLAWELSTGDHPFGSDPTALLARMTELMEGRAATLSRTLPLAGLDPIARRCMRAVPAERYQSSAELAADLRALASGGVPAPPAPAQASLHGLWWWQFHQSAIAILNCAMPVVAWAIREWTRPFGSVIFLAVLALATVSVTLRLNLVFTSRVHLEMLGEQRRRLRAAVTVTDAVLAVLLLTSAALLAGDHDAFAALLVGLAVITLASLAVIEPATTDAAGLGTRGSGLGTRGSGLGTRGSGLGGGGSGLGARDSGVGARDSGLGARACRHAAARHSDTQCGMHCVVPDIRPALERFLQPDQILDREIDRIAYASDASFYRLVPRAVVRPRSIADVQEIFRFSRASRIPVTFRGAGTSLSGQAITDGVLVDVARDWRRIEPLDGGRRVRVQPGAIGAHVNRALAAYAFRIGPDPASIDACTIGGILSNNASGMCCGVAQNSYQTLDSLVIVLPSGLVIDTASPGAEATLAASAPALAAGLTSLRDRVRATPALSERVRRKYLTKNTTGYSLNAFLDFDRPVDILRHLMIGAEGTLGFIAEAVLHAVPDLPVRYTGLLLFASIADACRAIAPLSAAGAAALEVMDRAALRSVQDAPGMPPSLARLRAGAAGLLVEFQEPAGSAIDAIATRAATAIRELSLVEPARFTADAADQALLWRIRKGMFPSVGAVRQRGTTVIIEDVAFPVAALADAVVDLQALFAAHGYDDAIIFGHAKDGNLHFVLTQAFNDRASIDQYAGFMDDVVRLVVTRYDGALKAEHGTGRNMAPFVEAEWGREAYAVMRAVKALVDPGGLLNPGVIINDDPRAHLADLKSLPAVEEEVDRCIECGFCEPRCPSRDLTLTPRQRIVVRREMARTPASAARLAHAFEYDGLDTCAADGLCAVACPVHIDTGHLTRRLRAIEHSAAANAVASWTARHFRGTARLVRFALAAGKKADAIAGRGTTAAVTRTLARLAGGAIPAWIEPMPAPAPPLPQTTRTDAAAVYFPSCVTRAMGALDGEVTMRSTAEAFVAVAARAGLPLVIPDDIGHLCCGTPYSSKGFTDAHASIANRTFDSLWRDSREGALPIVVDTSPCTYGLQSLEGLTAENRARAARMQIVDGVDFFAGRVVPALEIRRRAGTITLHPVCSLVKMGLVPRFAAIASACSEQVFIPPSSGCCAFAGDRGWLVPELTLSATAAAAAEVRATPSDGCYSSSRTCEIGMTRATGQAYKSWIHLLDWATE